MLRLRPDFPRTELFSLKRWKCSVKAVSMHHGGRRNPHSGGNGGHSPGNRLGTFFFPLWQLVVETTLTLLDAVEMLHNSFDPERDNVIVLGSRAWHPGVVGIVASQLMRRYHKPTFVIAFDESGVGKGSGRSIPGVSLVQAIHHCADTLVSGGGHDMAAGLVIEEARMDDFRRAFNRYVSETTTEEQRSPVLNIDMEVSFQALTLDLLDSYEKLEPFGNSNPQPLFMSSDVFPTEPPKRVGTNHLKLFMRQGMVERDAIFFNGAERELPNPPWDIAFTIDRNVYRGRASLSISIQEIRSHREM